MVVVIWLQAITVCFIEHTPMVIGIWKPRRRNYLREFEADVGWGLFQHRA